MVLSTYESWLAIQQNCPHRIDGKQRWLNVFKSDLESIELSGSNFDVIKQKAQEILDRLNAVINEVESAPNAKKLNRKLNHHMSSIFEIDSVVEVVVTDSPPIEGGVHHIFYWQFNDINL